MLSKETDGYCQARQKSMVTNGFELKANVNIAQLDHDGLVYKDKLFRFSKKFNKNCQKKIHQS